MVAKCGRVKAWHWAHLSNYNCDPWWESETQWHRDWKNRFPTDWQEVVHVDEKTGERHIADVKTPHDLVIEFQHSPLDYAELVSRESFYKNMIWIVDGDRGSLDPANFHLGFQPRPLEFRPLIHLVKWWGRGQILHKWSEASAPVYIDFGPQGLWRFLEFSIEDKVGVFLHLRQEWLVAACASNQPPLVTHIRKEEEERYVSSREWGKGSGRNTENRRSRQ